jgi:hypothetical protein
MILGSNTLNVLNGAGFNINTNVKINNSLIGNLGHGGGSAYTAFTHTSRSNVHDYGVLVDNVGNVFLNCLSNTGIYFRESNVNKMILTNGNLWVSGYATLNGLNILSNQILDLAFGASNREQNAGKISYEGFGGGYLTIVGAGTTAGNRWVQILDNLSVGGNIVENGSYLGQKYTLSNTMSNYLPLSGGVLTGSLSLNNGLTIDFGYGKVGREVNAGKIGYESFGACNLHIVGAGTGYLTRGVKIWDNIDVEGTVKEGGSLLSTKYALSNTMSNYLLKSGADYMTGNLKIIAGNYIDFGYGSPNREASAGMMGYDLVDFGFLDIFGSGSNAGNRWVRINDKLEVGSINEGGVALSTKYALSNTLSNLAVGSHNHDSTYLKLSGGSMTGNIQMSNTQVIEFGAFKTKQQDAGKITYGNWTANTLEIVGGHASSSSERVVKIYDKLNVGVVNSLSISDFGYGNDWQGISHSNSANSTGFALLQNYSGTTLLNCQGSQSVDIQESNVSIARFKKSEWMIGENAFTTRASNQAGSNWYVKTGYVSCDNTGWSGTTTKTKSFLIEKEKLWNSSTGVGGFLQVIIKSTSDQYAITLWSGTITQVFANAPFIFESIKVADSSSPPTNNVSITSVDYDGSWNIRFNLSANSARTLHIGWKWEGYK